MTQPNPPSTATIDTLYQDIRQLIEAAKTHVATQVNQALVLTYWQIGKTIKTELLQDARSEYGLATLKQLAQQLQQEYGAGFSRLLKNPAVHCPEAPSEQNFVKKANFLAKSGRFSLV